MPIHFANIGRALYGLDAARTAKEAGPVRPVRGVAGVPGEATTPAAAQTPAAVVEVSERARVLAYASAQKLEEPIERVPRSTPRVMGGSSSERPAERGEVAETPAEETPGTDAETPEEAIASQGRVESESGKGAGGGRTAAGDGSQLSADEQKQVEALKKRDAEVKTHEAAHQAQGGGYAGSASYTYQTGPDGKRYAIGGEVPIDVGPVAGDPEATLRKMQQVQRAALAPAEPSSADTQIAASAAKEAQRARAEMAKERYAQIDGLGRSSPKSEPPPGSVRSGAETRGGPQSAPPQSSVNSTNPAEPAPKSPPQSRTISA
jgi:hypothetical protein